jgi:hypothetical protein
VELGDPSALVARARDLGMQAGVVIDGPTAFEAVEPYLDERIDLLLVMTIKAGFGGQAFVPEHLDKVRRAAAIRDELGAGFRIQVDGGIDPQRRPQRCRGRGRRPSWPAARSSMPLIRERRRGRSARCRSVASGRAGKAAPTPRPGSDYRERSSAGRVSKGDDVTERPQMTATASSSGSGARTTRSGRTTPPRSRTAWAGSRSRI